VINTDPSETLQMPGGQLFLEGFYQLFINSSLNSSCGQLKEKHICEKKCIISLTLHTLPFLKQRNSDRFRIDLECRLNPIDTYFVICGGIFAVHFENHSRNLSTAGVYKSRKSVLYKLAPNTCGFSELNILHVNFPVDKILMCFLYVRQICRSAFYTT
jgi:hypothetical protein